MLSIGQNLQSFQMSEKFSSMTKNSKQITIDFFFSTDLTLIGFCRYQHMQVFFLICYPVTSFFVFYLLPFPICPLQLSITSPYESSIFLGWDRINRGPASPEVQHDEDPTCSNIGSVERRSHFCSPSLPMVTSLNSQIIGRLTTFNHTMSKIWRILMSLLSSYKGLAR